MPSAPAELEAAFISDDYVDRLIESIRAKSKSVVGDLNTVKGRKVYISLAASIRSSKVAIDDAGKNLVAEMKKRPALVDASRRKIREALDELTIEVRKPVTDWEAEQDRIKAEQQMLDWHTEALADNEAWDKTLAERFESDHEIALLLNDKFDRDAAEKKAEAERQRVAHEQEIARQAAEQARKEAEEAQRIEREAAAHREAALIAQKEQAERDRVAAQERAEREAREALERTALLAQQAREQAEREKQEAIAAERLRAEQAEAARLAEEKRIADEAAERAANETHRKQIGTAVVNALMSNAGLTREQAIATLTALKDNRIPHASITY
ncbi:hypothetical protein ASF13_16385 [Erwinia sp. Leaf53]|nr:hypothetical protein ASF13_16385 [Erwinia sp. Leaf53]